MAIYDTNSGVDLLQVDSKGINAEGGKFIVTDSNNGYTKLWGRDIDINGQRALVGTDANPDRLTANTLYVNYNGDFINGTNITGPTHLNGLCYNDGFQVVTNHGISKNATGYNVENPGIITQWGKIYVEISGGVATAHVTFPIAFNGCTHVSVNLHKVDGGAELVPHYIVHATDISNYGFTIRMKNIDGRNYGSSADLTFFAVGC